MVTSPEGKVIPQQLHDESRILVRLLIEGIKFSNSVIKRRLGNRARTIRRIEDLIVEHREVECKSKANGVGRGKLGGSNSGSSGISIQSG